MIEVEVYRNLLDRLYPTMPILPKVSVIFDAHLVPLRLEIVFFIDGDRFFIFLEKLRRDIDLIRFAS